MTAPLFLVDPVQLAGVAAGSLVVLDGSEGRHAVRSLRLRRGEQVLVTDGAGTVVHGQVAEVGVDRLTAEVTRAEFVPERSPRLVLAQALAKGDRDEQAIEAATELGVDEVLPWQAERSVVAWRGDRESKSRTKWTNVLLAASKQSRRSRVPLLGPTVRTDDLAARAGAGALVLVLHEEAVVPLASTPVDGPAEIIVVVGPEGGIAPLELDRLTAAGARIVRLGPEVLRTSSAGPAALAVLNARLRWGG